MAMLAVMCVAATPRAAAQSDTLHREECYTLTNGRLYWYEHPTWEVDGATGAPRYQTDVAFDHITATDSWNELHPYSSEYVYHISAAGTIYARLDLTDPDHPTLSSTTTFDEYCVWHRTGYTGYYYQEHDGYFYYLIGGESGSTIGKVAPGAATDRMSLWYNWDFGAAVKEVTYVDGSRKEKYFWLMYSNSAWTMSCNSYQRPEDIIYDNYDFSGTSAAEAANASSKRYYCTNTVDGINYPAGNGALVMPSTVIHFAKRLHDLPANYGLQNFSLVDGSSNTITSMAFQDVATINTTVNQSATAIPEITVTPEYWEYKEEIYRYGINTNYRLRSEDEFGSAGVPTFRYYYYYGGSMHSSASYDQTAAPTPTASDLVVSSVTYSLSPSAYRYMRFNNIVDPGPITVSDPSTPVTLTCFQVPPRNAKARLTVVVTYTNGVKQSRYIDIDMDDTYNRTPMPTAENAPVIHGSVFGGGRMANVGQNTNITIHNTDSIYAVYGGNDIAGWVQGDGGATIQIGTEQTSAAAPVKIGWVYGGGCGFYTYRGIVFSSSHGYPYMPGTEQYGLAYQNYYFGNSTHVGSVYPWGTVPTWDDPANAVETMTIADTAHLVWPDNPIATGFTYIPATHNPEHVDNTEDGNGGNGTIPYIKTAHITIGAPGDGQESHNDYITIDSLFGGAENAFIGVQSTEETPANAVSLDINGGTIFSVFGGNNYGGSVANTATVLVTVNNTKLPPVLTGSGAGTSHVSGNPILESTSDISHLAGFGREYGIRYLFGGGNLVDGSHAYVEINGGILDTVFGGGNSATVHLPWVKVNCQGSKFICDNESYWKENPAGFGTSNLTGEVGNYNIRTIFGGNNKADMTTLSYVELAAGGVSTTYGGGNMGDMLNEDLISRPNLLALMSQTLASSQITSPIAVGSIVYTPPTSEIVCDYVYGGCRMANVKHSSGCVLYGGMFGYVYGGNDISGDVGSTIPTTVSGGRGYRDGAYIFLAGNVEVVGDAVGGSDGYYHCDSLGVYYKDDDIFDNYNGVTNYDPYHEYSGKQLPTHNNTYLAMFDSDPDPNKKPVVYGNITTGGTHSNVGFDEGPNYVIMPADDVRNGSTHLSLLGGLVKGNVFGGGYMSSVYGLGYIHVGGDVEIQGSLFAGNDLVGSVEPFHGYTFTGVPDEASYMAATATNGMSLNVKDGSSWNPIYSCYVLLDGTPKIRSVYGGGNGAYDYDGTRPEYNLPSLCIPESGGVNRPLQSSSFIDINVEGGRIDTVFGGGNGIGVRDQVVVLLNSQNNTGQYVGVIFGGNNRDDMTTCVPDILLTKGRVGDVYGGGNSGSMKGSAEFTDICGRSVTGISTYVKVDNSTAQVDGTIYGGCRMADVTGMAYVDIRAGVVHNVYGGNDISGTVSGNTRVDVSGGTVHNIFGGSNGKYDYDYITEGSGDNIRNYYKIYNFDKTHDAANLVAENPNGRPFVDSTTVNLFGGTITTDVYGGGNLGDCRLTLVEVNDQVCTPASGALSLTVNGSIYGGGKGLDTILNATRHGNVLTPENDDKPSRTHVNLRHAHLLESADGKVKAYGGGRGGDVMDTYITAFSTWGTPFDEIYGGCWGSDVRGETHVIMDGSTANLTAMTAENVYGGNDFTGNTYATNITINSGKYGNIFGGGNGAYDVTEYNTGVYSGNFAAEEQRWNSALVVGQPRRLYEPNNEYAFIDFNDGTVTGNLYGGGRQGTTMRYERNADGTYKTHGGGASKVPDTLRTLSDPDKLPYTDPTNYSYIIVNVKNGTFEHDIYAGGMGKDGGNWIVYGFKELNIEDGLVKESVYGGSENVNDGYPRECVSTSSTTLRPSSVVNITGGTIKNNVYGGGYLGNVYGSVYVNVGTDAVENCHLWTTTINGQANAYAKFKPGAAEGYTPAMATNALQLQASIYGGANWGDNVGSADFSKQGFYGGVSRILVDGEGYNTYNDAAHESLPLMNIVHSIIGSGTSAEGGDVYNRIDVRNYGAINPSTCKPTRQLKAIQRADGLWLENTVIDYTGATDAISAYLSQQYTINRVDTLNCVGYNIVDIEATMTNINNVNFLYNKAYSDYLVNTCAPLDEDWRPRIERTTTWFEPSLTYAYVPGALIPTGNVCSEGASMCDKLNLLDRTADATSVTALVINNGINVDILGANDEYGAIRGYGILVAQNNTNAVVTARSKYQGHNVNDGGFTTTCIDQAQSIKSYSGTNNEEIEWCDCYENGLAVTANDTYCNYPSSERNWLESKAEYPYSNYSTSYRVWKLGNGKRRRYAVIQAHSNPDSLYTLIDQDLPNTAANRNYSNKKITVRYKEGDASCDSLYNLSLAYAKLILPPTTPGHYYKISNGGVVIDDENQEMRLTDVSYKPVWDDLTNTWMLSGSTTARPTVTTGASADVSGTNYEATGTASTDHGNWHELALTSAGSLTGANHIYNYTAGHQYFGLMMSSGNNFSTDAPYSMTGWEDGTTISGNAHTNMISNFSTAQVGSTVNASPTVDLYLLYDNRFSHTIVGTVNFTLEEYVDVPTRNSDGRIVSKLDHTTVIADANDQWLSGYSAADAEWTATNIHSDIEVELTITTILQDFATMDYEVLAMYNEGRSDNFARKIILPATLQQRELYLEKVSWFPTEVSASLVGYGDTIRTASDPKHFYLTDKTSAIKNQPSSEHSYFGMTIQPVENVSNTLVTAVSWHSISMTEPLDLFTAVYGTGNTQEPTRAYNDQYYQESGTTPAHTIGAKSLTVPDSRPYGIKVGNLDGRGEAAINVVLKYDGSRVYDKITGKGYVGKVVMTMVSYTGGDYAHPNRFDIIVNVKTRARGDTIYLATYKYLDDDGVLHDDYFDANGKHTVPGTTHYSQVCDNWNDENAGKHPRACATSFYDALTKVYQEGDVIAIMGPVTITDREQSLIKGNEYMPIPVIRYEGHHSEMPGEACVYRGPMITVTGEGTSFAARCIDFKGSMISKIVPDGTATTAFTDAHPRVYDLVDDNNIKYADTNMVYGPVIRVMNNATVTLQHGVILEENNNAYWNSAYQTAHSSATFDPSLMGAVSVTNGGRLNLVNSVNIKHNISNPVTSATNWHIKPESGAVYVDGGTMYLSASNAITAIHIDSNYLGDATPYWIENEVDVSGVNKLVHYDFNNSSSDNGYYPTNTAHKRSNVFLAREEATSVPASITDADDIQAYKDTVDSKSCAIVFDEVIAENSRIGVSKWFPDANEELRDTIQVAFQADATYMIDAEANQNFFADDPKYFTFYNYGVNNQRMFLARCATFKYQQRTNPRTELVADGSGIYTDSAIYYRPLAGASCPIGGDSLIVRAQGGFFPYTYTWYNPGANFTDDTDDEVIRTRKTANTNNEVNKQLGLATPNYAPYAMAVADTLYTSNVDMPYNESTRTMRYVVTTSDASGHCTLRKNVEVRLVKHAGAGADPFEKTGTVTAWTALDKPNTVGTTCTGDRNYKAVTITPKVWSPGNGVIAVTAPGSDDRRIFIINDDASTTNVNGLTFCEGDVLKLSTSPKSHLENMVDGEGNIVYDEHNNIVQTRVYDSKFVMWDFDPYYTNPTSYVVPSTDQTVVAYFAPLTYWKDYVTSTAIAKAVYDNNYTYTTRANAGNANAGMVTTYNGDVHIYNENGLAWLISCINGYNGTQARTFHFNRVYIHYKSGGYDMKEYLWTPMGTLQHPFEGMLIGVGNDSYNADSLTIPWTAVSGSDTTWTAPVVIKNIIVDEPNLNNAGFFAVIDSARIINIELQGTVVRGAQNVGALAAKSSNSRITRVNVLTNDDTPGASESSPGTTTTTILSTHYLSGGLLGLSETDTIRNSTVAAKFIGDAVYSGGVIGHGTSTKAMNNSGHNISRMRGLYVGGIAGYLDGTAPTNATLFRRKTNGNPAVVQNNYFRVSTDGLSQRMGGVAGYAENAILENNYIYGDLSSTAIHGGVTAVASDGSVVNHNYYENRAAKLPTGSERGTATVSDVSAFEGQGNQVKLNERVYGVDNLTRVLNIWVREHNTDGGYLTWRSDLEDNNNGYPVFGQPDMIPVHDSMRIDGCDEVEWNGVTYTADATVTTHVVDSTEMIDSTAALTIVIHHSVSTTLSDSATVEEGYEGYGFSVTPAEAMLLSQTIQQYGSAQMVLSDTLSTTFGCDSVITLTITFTGGLDIPEVEVTPTATVKVYPNPTTSEVNVEAEQMSHVELYDNEGRTLADYDAYGNDKIRINVNNLATGIYYLRIHTPTAVTIQKIVKK